MRQRELKFRAWNPTINKMLDWSFLYPIHSSVFFNSSYNWMQFTGLKDKYGKDIWEGDVLKTINGNWGVIKYEAPYFGLTVSETQVSLYTNDFFNNGEVVGNIYETPELITK